MTISTLFPKGLICTIKQTKKPSPRNTSNSLNMIWSAKVSDILLQAVIFTLNIKMPERNWGLVKGHLLRHKCSWRLSSASEGSHLRRHPARLRLPPRLAEMLAWSPLGPPHLLTTLSDCRNAPRSAERLRWPCCRGHSVNLQERRMCLPACTDRCRLLVCSFKYSGGTTRSWLMTWR